MATLRRWLEMARARRHLRHVTRRGNPYATARARQHLDALKVRRP